MLDIGLNGRPMIAILDIGASATVIDRNGVFAAGVALDRLDADQARSASGLDPHLVEMRRHRFGSLEMGDERMKNFHFYVATMRIRDTLPGRDVLRFNRILMS